MKGIMFTEPLFPKVVKGEKTQTRRIIALQPGEGESYEEIRKGEFAYISSGGMSGSYFPPYKLGTTVYLKEPYVLYDEQYQELRTNASGIQFAYRYGNNIPIAEITGKSDSKWKNKLFMPESATRYFIKIIAVRAERLQDISEDDCIKEGIDSFFNPLFSETRYKDYLNPNSECRSPQSSYASLINKINGKGTWESNPWVWVYDFVKTEKQ